MTRLLIIMLMLPMLACSQGNDLGFWEGTPEKLDGCRLFTIVKRVGDPPLTVVTNITDCYGNEQRISIGVADGSSVTVCSMTEPSSSPLIASITQTGWCSDPVPNQFQFWVDANRPAAISNVSEISINAWGPTGSYELFRTTNPASIFGRGNSVTFTDTHPELNQFLITVTARGGGTPQSRLECYVFPGQSSRTVFIGESFISKYITLDKREFYLFFGVPN